MPELPEVETVRRGLAPVMEGRTIEAVELRRKDLRFPLPHRFRARLAGRRVVALRRRAKYLLAELDDGATLLMHLGMSGSFRIDRSGAVAGETFHNPRGKDAAHDHVVFHLSGGHRSGGARVIYNDPRRFGFMLLLKPSERATHPFLAGLGPEPIDGGLDAVYLARRFAGRSAPLKAALLDQRMVAGLGNIYVCEALWRARLSPRRSAGTLTKTSGEPTARLEVLAASIGEVIADAVAAGGSSLRDYVQADGELGLFQHRFGVYGREGKPCLRDTCLGIVRRIVQSGRSTFFCPVCQR
jgi:formamidopyrimidine-DNA glycosylase